MKRRARAQVIVWVAVMLPLLFLPIVGLTMDAGMLFDAKRELQNVADGAARVGAMEIDDAYLHDVNRNPRGDVRIDADRAYTAVVAYFDRIGYRTADPVVDTQHDNRVVVTVAREVRPTFLRLLHVGNVRISATGRAAPCAGVLVATCT